MEMEREALEWHKEFLEKKIERYETKLQTLDIIHNLNEIEASENKVVQIFEEINTIENKLKRYDQE